MEVTQWLMKVKMMGAAKSDSYWLDALNAVEKRDGNWISKNMNMAVGTVPGVDFVSTVDLNGTVLSSAGNANDFTAKISDSYTSQATQRIATTVQDISAGADIQLSHVNGPYGLRPAIAEGRRADYQSDCKREAGK